MFTHSNVDQVLGQCAQEEAEHTSVSAILCGPRHASSNTGKKTVFALFIYFGF